MPSIMTRVFQSLFFPKVRLPPKPAWKKDFEAMGLLTHFKAKRRKGHLACCRISRSERPSSKVVVFAHPISRRGKYFFAKCRRLQLYLAQGYDCVVFDFNGFGESDRIDLLYWRDSKAVIEHVVNHWQPKHMVLHGISFGSFHMIRSIPALPSGSGVVLENTSRSLYDYWKRWVLTGYIVKAVSMVPPRFIKEMNVTEVFQQLARPDLRFYCIACEHDEFTPADEMTDLVAHITSPKRFDIYTNAKHFEAPEASSDQYRAGIRSVMHC